jgi:hypothetical protein
MAYIELASLDEVLESANGTLIGLLANEIRNRAEKHEKGIYVVAGRDIDAYARAFGVTECLPSWFLAMIHGNGSAAAEKSLTMGFDVEINFRIIQDPRCAEKKMGLKIEWGQNPKITASLPEVCLPWRDITGPGMKGFEDDSPTTSLSSPKWWWIGDLPPTDTRPGANLQEVGEAMLNAIPVRLKRGQFRPEDCLNGYYLIDANDSFEEFHVIDSPDCFEGLGIPRHTIEHWPAYLTSEGLFILTESVLHRAPEKRLGMIAFRHGAGSRPPADISA